MQTFEVKLVVEAEEGTYTADRLADDVKGLLVDLDANVTAVRAREVLAARE